MSGEGLRSRKAAASRSEQDAGTAEEAPPAEPSSPRWPVYLVAGSWVVLLCSIVAAVLLAPGMLTPPRGVETWLFFDGECNLCDGFVNFVVDSDSDALVKFGAIQKHQRKLAARGAPTDLSTLVLVQGEEFYTHSGAALRVFALLPQPYAALSAFYVVPTVVRDTVYRFVAAHRYEWFGHAEECRAPTPEFEARFLAEEE